MAAFRAPWQRLALAITLTILSNCEAQSNSTQPTGFKVGDATCAAIEYEADSNFMRVWVMCLGAFCMFGAIVVIPAMWCQQWHDRDQIDMGTVQSLKEKSFEKSRELEQTGQLPEAGIPTVTDAPELSVAKQHLKETSCINPEGNWRPIFGTKIAHMGEIGGAGMELYFRVIRFLGYIFVFKCVITAPIWMFSLQGNFVPDTGTFFARTTVGNLGNLVTDGRPQELRPVIVGCQAQDITVMTEWFGWLDFFAICMYTTAILYFKFRTIPSVLALVDASTVSCADYALEVNGLPRSLQADHEKYEETLREFLAETIKEVRVTLSRKASGCLCCKRYTDTDKTKEELERKVEIPEVALVRDYSRRLARSKTLATTRLDLAVAQKAARGKEVTKLAEKLEKLEEGMKERIEPETQLPVLRAFVIFKCDKDKRAVEHAFRFNSFTIIRICPCSKRFHKGPLYATRAPEPTDILWENQDFDWKKRAIRKLLIFIAWLFIMALSTALMVATEGGRKAAEADEAAQLLGSVACDSGTYLPPEVATCNATEVMLMTFETAQQLTKASAVDCYCLMKGYSKIMQDPDLVSFCGNYLMVSGSKVGIGLMASGVVFIINQVLKAVVDFFVIQERHISISDLNSSLMFKTFVSQYINTAVLIFILNWNTDFLRSMSIAGDYTSFERGWYADVGGPLLITLMVNSFGASAGYLVGWLISAITRCRYGSLKTNIEVDVAFTNPEFDTASRFAQVLNTVFCTVTYSAGLPLANVFAVGFFVLTYWVDRIILLRASKRPPSLTARQAHVTLTYCLIAAPIHCGVAVAMYSHKCTFPSVGVGGSIASMAKNTGGGDDFAFMTTRSSTWMLFGFLTAVICLMLMGIVFFIFAEMAEQLREFVGMLCSKKSSAVADEEEAEKEKKGTKVLDMSTNLDWDEAKAWIEALQPPASYRIDAREDWKVTMRVILARGNTAATSSSVAVAPVPTDDVQVLEFDPS